MYLDDCNLGALRRRYPVNANSCGSFASINELSAPARSHSAVSLPSRSWFVAMKMKGPGIIDSLLAVAVVHVSSRGPASCAKCAAASTTFRTPLRTVL